jgi:hypothetical protein
MSDSEPKNDTQKPLKPAWLNQHRLLSAILLHGLWKLRWYQTVFILWPMLMAAAWGASPYFMVYVVGMPEPGTAPRYVGTIKFEGELQRTKSGWIPPKYFIQTSKGDVEFHCRYRPTKGECWFTAVLGVKPEPNEVYEIGYDPYWGLDYIKYPDRLSMLSDYWEPKNVSRARVARLYPHTRSAVWFGFLALTYLYLMWLACQKSHPLGKTVVPSSGQIPNPLQPNFQSVEKTTGNKSTQPKSRRSFFD